MSCCGGKRAQLARDRRIERAAPDIEPATRSPVRERKPRTFVYVGDASLTVRGAVSGTAYRFAQAGTRLEVSADDVFGMMAERDLSIVRD